MPALLHVPVPPDLEARIRQGEPLRLLFDANVLLDVFLQRDQAVPAARALTFAEVGTVTGLVCASTFGVICHHGARPGHGRSRRERLLAEELMRFLSVLSLTEDVLRAAMDYERLSFEDAQVAAAGHLAHVDAILTNDGDFIRNHQTACTPQVLVDTLETELESPHVCRVVKVSQEGAFRVEISDLAGGWRQALPLAGFPSREAAERVAGIRKEEE